MNFVHPWITVPPAPSNQGGVFGSAAEMSKLWQLALFILTWLFGFGDSVAPAAREIALVPAGPETENGFEKYNKTNLNVSLSVFLPLSVYKNTPYSLPRQPWHGRDESVNSEAARK